VKLHFERSFAKDLHRLLDTKVHTKVKEVIDECQKVSTIADIRNLKKLQGYETFYRIRVGDYRIGIECVNSELFFYSVSTQERCVQIFPLILLNPLPLSEYSPLSRW